MNKTRNDSTLFKLPEAQQAQLYDWLLTLGYTETLKKLEQPPPEGFALRSHRSCLHRFYKRYRCIVRTEAVAVAKENRPNPADTPILLSDAEQSFQHAAHEIATSPMTGEDFDKISRWLEWHKDAENRREYIELARQQLLLARERLAFQRKKYELDIAKLALEHVAGLQQIRQNIALDTQSRIRAAREELFGPAPENTGQTLAPTTIDPKWFPTGRNL